jgi:hypothetical protein
MQRSATDQSLDTLAGAGIHHKPEFRAPRVEYLFGVSVVPGAIGAWRTEAVRAQGGYHADTVAEDADLTMALLQAGYKVEYEDRAIAYTEASTQSQRPDAPALPLVFGILQAVYKHRKATVREGALGWIAIPNIVNFPDATAAGCRHSSTSCSRSAH